MSPDFMEQERRALFGTQRDRIEQALRSRPREGETLEQPLAAARHAGIGADEAETRLRTRIANAARSDQQEADQQDAARRIAAGVQELTTGPSDELRRRAVEEPA